MIKNCIIMLMVFTMTASAWCCGVRAITPAQAQNQVAQQQPQPNIPISQPAPAPVPQPETLAELIKDVAADYDKFGSNDQEVAFDDNANERLSNDTLTSINNFAAAFELPVFSGDTDESRILRNEKQINIAEKQPEVLAEVTSFINSVNEDVSKFVSENNELLRTAPQSLIDAYYDQVSVLHGEFFKDLEAATKLALGTANVNEDNLVTNNINGDEQDIQLETDNPAALVTSADAPSAQNIIDRLNFSKEQFLNDFKLVRESTVSEIEGLSDAEDDTSTSVNRTPDFDGALDTSFKSPASLETNSISFDVLNPLSLPGGFDRGTSSIVQMITELKNRFPNTQLASDLQFFLDVFPPASEVAVQDSLEPRSDLFIDQATNLNNITGLDLNANNPNQLSDFETENTFTTSSFDIGLDGRLVGVDRNNNPQQPESVTTIVSNVSSISGDNRGFNSRSFGGSPGQHQSVSIFINNKQYDIVDNVFTSPIVIDMDGDGKLEASNGVYLPHVYKDGRIVEFDMNGDGFVDLTEWVGKNDGLLIQYDASKPLSGAQLFGDCDGFVNGYEKLKSLDADENGTLEGSEISTLSVWQDKNLNAKVDSGEMKSLTELNITELSVEHDNFVSSCVMDGKDVTMWDWYPSMFRVKKRK